MATTTVRQTETTSDDNRAFRRALAAAQTAHENRGRDIVILDLRELTPEFDFFVLATGNSARQLHAMSEEIDHTLEDDLHDHRLGREGFQQGGWVLHDYGDVVIHLFDEKTRDFYRLDELWCAAKRVPFAPKSSS